MVIYNPEEEPIEQVNQTEPIEEVIEESPTREANGDDLADMFKAPKADDLDIDSSDLISVDIQKDIVDGDLSDITTVSNDEIVNGPRIKKRKIRRIYRINPQSRIRGVGY